MQIKQHILEKMIRSNVVYKLTCPRCESCYVGQTSRQLQRRFSEHVTNKGPMKIHLQKCDTIISKNDVQILASTSRGGDYLLTLEALFQHEIKPEINTKDEYKSRALTIKW